LQIRHGTELLFSRNRKWNGVNEPDIFDKMLFEIEKNSLKIVKILIKYGSKQ